jgi:hypothetical protein
LAWRAQYAMEIWGQLAPGCLGGIKGLAGKERQGGMMMKKTIGIGALAVALVALWPTTGLEAASKQVFRFQAEWNVNPDGSQCDVRNSALSLSSSQADTNVVFFVYQVNLHPCDPNSPLQIFQGVGPVTITGNQSHLAVQGTIFTSDERPVQINLRLRKTGNLPDPAPGEKLVSACATGQVIFGGTDLTGGVPSTRAQISKSKS